MRELYSGGHFIDGKMQSNWNFSIYTLFNRMRASSSHTYHNIVWIISDKWTNVSLTPPLSSSFYFDYIFFCFAVTKNDHQICTFMSFWYSLEKWWNEKAFDSSIEIWLSNKSSIFKDQLKLSKIEFALIFLQIFFHILHSIVKICIKFPK